MKHGAEWLTLGWTAKGNEKQIAAASIEFIKMLVAVAMAALSALGARSNYGNALKIANSMPTGALPALAVAGGGRMGGAGAQAGVLVGPGTGSIGAAGNAVMQADDKNVGGGGKNKKTADAEPGGPNPDPSRRKRNPIRKLSSRLRSSRSLMVRVSQPVEAAPLWD